MVNESHLSVVLRVGLTQNDPNWGTCALRNLSFRAHYIPEQDRNNLAHPKSKAAAIRQERPAPVIESCILMVRGQKVLLDADLAALLCPQRDASMKLSSVTLSVSRRTSCSNSPLTKPRMLSV